MQSPELEQEASNGWKSGSDDHSKSGCFGTLIMPFIPYEDPPYAFFRIVYVH